MSTELKPCPFCGGTPAYYTPEEMLDYDMRFNGVTCYYIACGACGASIGEKHEADAVAAWNRRVDE